MLSFLKNHSVLLFVILDLQGRGFDTTLKEYLVVFITVQNLVGITCGVFIIQKFEYYACFA